MRLRTLASSTLALTLIVAGPAAASASGLGSGPPDEEQAASAGELTLLATTDVHGHVLNWDYFANAPYPAGEALFEGVTEEDAHHIGELLHRLPASANDGGPH